MNIMPGSSPADLVVTFRSIPRRLREAQADAPASVTAAPTRELNTKLELAARQLGCQATPEAIAGAIEKVPHARDWDDDKLEALREAALDIGRTLRSIESASAAWRQG
jgi:hypothetical protein